MFLAGFHFFCGEKSWLLTHGFSPETEHQKHEGLVEMIFFWDAKTRWWFEGFFLCSPLKLGKISNLTNIFCPSTRKEAGSRETDSFLRWVNNLTNIFQMGWLNHQPLPFQVKSRELAGEGRKPPWEHPPNVPVQIFMRGTNTSTRCYLSKQLKADPATKCLKAPTKSY